MMHLRGRRPKWVMFFHIPKTAGMTLYWVIDQQYRPETIFTIDWRDIGKSIDELIDLPEEEKKKISIVRGHIYPSIAFQKLPPANTFTFLRDPVERIISLYYFIRKTPHNPLHHEVVSKNMSLQEYVLSGISPELENGQTKMLSIPWLAYGQCSYETFECAKAYLDKMNFVGITERFDETLLLLKNAFGWNWPWYFKHNATQHPRKAEISRETLDIIEEYHAYDRQLYEYGKQLFEQQLLKQSDSFRKELKYFMFFNRMYSKIHPFYLPVKYKIQSLLHHR